MNEHLYRLYRQNLRRNTIVKEYRNMHKFERALYFWPMWAYVRIKGRRLKPEQTITPATAGFLTPENNQEDA